MTAGSASQPLGVDFGDYRQQKRFRNARRVFGRPTAVFAAAILGLFLILAAFPGLIAPYGENESTNAYFQSPGADYWFGTDNLGRDVFSRVIYGARASFTVGILAVLMGTVSGSILGMATGYFRGKLDYVGQRFVDILMSLPGILMALVIAAGLGASVWNVAFAIAVAILPTGARVVRGATLSVASMPYIEAARSMGAGHVRIMARHVLPNVAAPMVVIASVQLGFAIIAEASLSYLGLGVPSAPPRGGPCLAGHHSSMSRKRRGWVSRPVSLSRSSSWRRTWQAIPSGTSGTHG